MIPGRENREVVMKFTQINEHHYAIIINLIEKGKHGKTMEKPTGSHFFH